MAIDNAQLSAYYQALFKEIPEPAVVLDREYRVLDANPAAAQLLGYSRRTCGHPESTCLSEEIPMLWQAFMTGCVNADAGKVNSISDVRMGNLYQ